MPIVNFREGFFDCVEECDQIITFYQDAAREIERSFINNEKHKVEVLHHIVNTDNFYGVSLEKKIGIKKTLLGEDAVKGFVIANLNVNQYPEEIGFNFKGILEFCAKYPEKGANSVLIIKGESKHLGDGVYTISSIIERLVKEFSIDHSNRIVIIRKIDSRRIKKHSYNIGCSCYYN